MARSCSLIPRAWTEGTRSTWPAALVTTTVCVSDHQIGPLSHLRVRYSCHLPNGDNLKSHPVMASAWCTVGCTLGCNTKLFHHQLDLEISELKDASTCCCPPLPPHCVFLRNGETKVGKPRIHSCSERGWMRDIHSLDIRHAKFWSRSEIFRASCLAGGECSFGVQILLSGRASPPHCCLQPLRLPVASRITSWVSTEECAFSGAAWLWRVGALASFQVLNTFPNHFRFRLLTSLAVQLLSKGARFLVYFISPFIYSGLFPAPSSWHSTYIFAVCLSACASSLSFINVIDATLNLSGPGGWGTDT